MAGLFKTVYDTRVKRVMRIFYFTKTREHFVHCWYPYLLVDVVSSIAVKVMKAGTTVGHLSKKISFTCSLFMLDDGSISCKVMDPHRRYLSDLVQGGLEIPHCKGPRS